MYTTTKKAVKAGKLVNTDHVNKLVRNYKKERWVHNSNRIGKEDSLSVWYSLEELENFLAQVKDQGGDGIKLYFGAYDADSAPSDLYEDRQTVVLVGTKDKETSNGIVTKDIYVARENGTSILAYNIGRICPPICNTGDDGDFGGIGITIVDKGDAGFVVA